MAAHNDAVFEALDRAPLAEEDLSPEQQVELAAILAEYEAGRARLVAHEDMPSALEEIGRSHAA